MSNLSRILMVLAVLMIGGIFLFPIWFIKLDAPQFPEGGLIMYIWVNKITGYEENTLNSINILNHYIGMKKIVPDAIPELKIIPVVLIAIAIFGLLVAALKKRWLMLTWLAVFLLASIIGIYDFYTWLYDYGHNLDPQAPIKVPGMSYQPPLLGVKWLLNFRSVSLPYTGSLFAAISILLAMAGIIYDCFMNQKKLIKTLSAFWNPQKLPPWKRRKSFQRMQALSSSSFFSAHVPHSRSRLLSEKTNAIIAK